jgi:hypothetical protein
MSLKLGKRSDWVAGSGGMLNVFKIGEEEWNY